MNMDDDLDRRIREALTTPRASDRLDVDEFLTSVHHGAKVRRVKKQVSVALGALLFVTGGGFAVNATGVFSGTQTPVADGPSGTNKTMSTSRSSGGTDTITTKEAPETVTISPVGPIDASDVTPVSLTATGTDHQWILAVAPGKDCGRDACATVFSTDEHGKNGHWADLGQLPASATTVDDPAPDSVSALRVTRRDDGSSMYDGWAYGDALWSTHDSGKTWSTADAPPGQVTQLESWGGFVYAAVLDPPPGTTDSSGDPTGGMSTQSLSGTGLTPGTDAPTTTLYRSPTTSDSW